MQMATTSFSSARCAAHNQRGRPAEMRVRERERERERDSLIHISTYLYFLGEK